MTESCNAEAAREAVRARAPRLPIVVEEALAAAQERFTLLDRSAGAQGPAGADGAPTSPVPIPADRTPVLEF